MAVIANSKRMKAAVKTRPADALPIADAVAAIKKFPAPKFDQTVDIVFRLGVDAAQADQIVRGAIVLPNGIGKALRVAVFAKGAQAEAAKAAGADYVGEEDLAQRILGGWTDFDACIAAPDMMKVVGPLGKVLGPRGLMPSPRAGTVTPDVAKTVGEYKAGKVEFRNDKSGNVHAPVGKLSFDAEKLAANVQAFVDRIVSLKPGSVKGVYIKSAHLSAAMSPSVRLAI
jgi:large subunit ribosomal protein L1